jgi:hypothetical protein
MAMKKIVALLIVVAMAGIFAYPQTRAVAIEYVKIGFSAANTGIEATKNAMNNDLAEYQKGTQEQRIACTKRHVTPLDMLHPSMKGAGQQDEPHKAMEQ